MDVNDNAGILNKRVALESIASRLAPTMVRCRSQNPGPPLSPVGATVFTMPLVTAIRRSPLYPQAGITPS